MRFRVLTLAFLAAAAGCGDDAKPRAPETRQASAPAAWEFHDVAAEAGLTAIIRSGTERQEYIPEVKGLGVALLDYDGDGRLDVLFTAGSSVERAQKGEPGFGCLLYRNETAPGGPLRFVDVTKAAGIPATRWAGGPTVGDYDGDGRPDVLITGLLGNLLLRNNGDGTFEDTTRKAGVAGSGWSTGAAFGDLDQDGDLDLYVARYLTFDVANPPRHGGRWNCVWKQREVLCGPRGFAAESDLAFRNEGNGTFTDVTAAWGFDATEPQYGLGVLISDLNSDGRPDVFVANDSAPNHLFLNQGGSFVDKALELGVAYGADGREMAGMGVDALDLNGDAVPEIVVTNFSDQATSVFASERGGHWFESSRAVNVARDSYPMLSWGVGIQDFDNDAWADIFIANGHVYVSAGGEGTDSSYRQKNQLFRNDGAGRFVEIGARLGPDFATARVGRGAAFGDLDLDGDLDVVVVNLNDRPTLLENRLPAGNAWASIALEQPGPNREGIGAAITVAAGGRTQAREVRRNYSFLASSDARAHFGLGKAPIGAVSVRWPDGTTERFEAVPGSARTTLRRGGGR